MLICKPVVTTRCSSIHFLCWFLSDLCDLWWWSNSNENQGSRFVHGAKIRTLVWWKPVTLNENLGPNVHTTSSAYTPFWDENLKPQGIYRLKFWTTAMGWKPISKEDPRYETGMNFRDELVFLEGPAYGIYPSAPDRDIIYIYYIYCTYCTCVCDCLCTYSCVNLCIYNHTHTCKHIDNTKTAAASNIVQYRYDLYHFTWQKIVIEHINIWGLS